MSLNVTNVVDVPRLIDFTRDLIATPSLSLEEEAISLLIEKEMRALGYDRVFRDELHNVVGIIEGSGNGRSLMLNGHIDHAGVGQMPNPYSAEEIDGNRFGVDGPVIYGRGASDMKAAVAAMVHAGGAVKRLGRKLAGDLVVTCVAREEMARGEGIKALLDAGIKTDYAVSGEATGLRVYLGHRGKSEWKVTVKGRTSHAGDPAGGINAILKMNKFLRALEKSYPLPDHQFLGKASWTVIDISAAPGALTPIVPDVCEAILDRRFLPEETKEKLQQGLEQVIRDVAGKDPDFHGEVTLSKWFPAMLTPRDNSVVQAAFRAREEVIGTMGEPGSWYFGVDGTFLNEAGIPCVGFGPANEYMAHTPEDHVPVSHLEKACLFYVAIASDICGVHL